MTIAFEAGKTYWTRSIGDHDCIFRLTVAKRTAKMITTTEGKRLKISVYEGVEQVLPHGRYSMCAVIGADKCEETEEPVDTWKAENDAHAARSAAETPAETSNVISFAAYKNRAA